MANDLVLCATNSTDPLHCASTTAAGTTTALAAAPVTSAGCIGRVAETAATASPGATDGGLTSGALVVARALLRSGALPVANHLHHQFGVDCGGEKGLARHRVCLVSREPVLDGSSLVSLPTYCLNRIDKQRQRNRAAELVGRLVKGKLGVRVGVHRCAGGSALQDWRRWNGLHAAAQRFCKRIVVGHGSVKLVHSRRWDLDWRWWRRLNDGLGVDTG